MGRKGKERKIAGVDAVMSETADSFFQILAWAGLLRKVWPSCRVIVGLRVNKWMHRQLLENVEAVILVGRNNIKKLKDSRVEKDLSRFHRNTVQIDWTSNKAIKLCVPFLQGLAAAVADGKVGPGVTHLDLTGNDVGKESAAVKFSEALLMLPNLKQLNLSNSFLSRDTAAMIGRALTECKALTNLDVSGVRLEGEGARCLGEALHRCCDLTELHLGNMRMKGEELSSIATRATTLSALTLLSLRQNSFGEQTAVLRRWVEHLPSLTHLDLCGLWMQAAGMVALAPGLKRLTALARLDLSNCSIQTGAASLSVLRHCSRLTQLDLRGNSIDGEGASALAEGLTECPRLTRLDLTNNDIPSDGMQRLAVALAATSSLHSLEIRQCRLGDDAVRALVRLVEASPQLSLLDLRGSAAASTGPLGAQLRALRRPGRIVMVDDRADPG